jgi:type IV secretory pathway VirB9-like protein
MKAHWILIHLLLFSGLTTGLVLGQTEKIPNSPPRPHVSKLTIDAQNVTVLRLRPGFVSSVRVPEEVSSVVLGNSQEFKAEHSEAEPRLVFLKPLTAKPSETNALITTKSGHEIPLHLVSNGKTGGAAPQLHDSFGGVQLCSRGNSKSEL